MIKYSCDKCGDPAPFMHEVKGKEDFSLRIQPTTMTHPVRMPSFTKNSQLCAKCVREIFGDYGETKELT